MVDFDVALTSLTILFLEIELAGNADCAMLADRLTARSGHLPDMAAV
jgi:hypothetical protein